ncbi:hypothetical protein RND71_038392 [Anisodus tanguticus]|uniref:Uncharacterized protein n=1 Tax=Anisodus tanguticus TaxID=243964 RepID=A0AAE1QZY8_9SOLA|nr:hypothetical protein RND71_038392 [Anisodus tanguticus]
MMVNQRIRCSHNVDLELQQWRRTVSTGLQTLTNTIGSANLAMVKEFYANSELGFDMEKEFLVQVRDARGRHKYLKRANLTLLVKMEINMGKVMLAEIARVRNEGKGRFLYPSMLTMMLV